MLDYLTEEVLERQPEQLRTFLLETSILERLSGSLCDAVVGCSDSQRTLQSVERASLFLIPLDEERRWWRYHHLFAELLRATLQRLYPARVPELHRAATSWFERHHLPDDAIRHALAAGDPQWAAAIVEAHLEEQIWRRDRLSGRVRGGRGRGAQRRAHRPRAAVPGAIGHQVDHVG